MKAPTADVRIDRLLAGPAGLILLGALALRCIGVWHRRLWYDELLSANFSSHGPVETLLTVLRFDVHPPLYYLQLSLWGLFGSSPAWLMANSILWSVAAVGLLMATATRMYGDRVGLATAALLAVAPAALAYSDQVRMYAFISMLMVWVWWSQERWASRPSFRSGLLIAISQLCVIYAHTAGVFMVSGCVLYGAIKTLTELSPVRLRQWLLAECIVAVLAAPVLALGHLHTVTHPLAPTLTDALKTWTFLASGAASFDGLHVLVATGLGLALLAIAVATPSLRLQVATLVFAPLLVAAAISYAVKPIWLDRIFVPVVPFVALVLARFAVDRSIDTRIAPLVRPVCVGALGLFWLMIGISDQITRTKGDGIESAAIYVRTHAHPGDEVVFNKDLEFWAFNWIYAGPRWGDPIHAHLENQAWTPLMEKLPPVIRAQFQPSDTAYRAGGVDVSLSSPTQPAPDPAGDLISIGADPLPAPGRVMIERLSFFPFIVERWRRHPIGRPIRPGTHQ